MALQSQPVPIEVDNLAYSIRSARWSEILNLLTCLTALLVGRHGD